MASGQVHRSPVQYAGSLRLDCVIPPGWKRSVACPGGCHCRVGWTELHRCLFRSQDLSGAKSGERWLLLWPVKVVVGCYENAASVVDVRPKGQGVNHTVTPLAVSARCCGIEVETLAVVVVLERTVREEKPVNFFCLFPLLRSRPDAVIPMRDVPDAWREQDLGILKANLCDLGLEIARALGDIAIGLPLRRTGRNDPQPQRPLRSTLDDVAQVSGLVAVLFKSK